MRPTLAPVTQNANLRELAALFLRLGVTAFGGPAAHIAMMRDEVVSRRHWMTDGEFLRPPCRHQPHPRSQLDRNGHPSWLQASRAARAAAGWRLLHPAGKSDRRSHCLGYTRYGETPQAAWLMYGVSPVIIAIILVAVWKLAQSAITRVLPGVICASTAALSLWGVTELALLAGGGVVAFVASVGGRSVAVWVLGWGRYLSVGRRFSRDGGIERCRAGHADEADAVFPEGRSVLFGSGYVLLAFLRADLTTRWGWLTEQQLIGRRHGWSGDARTGLHDRDLHRVPARRVAGRRSGHGGDLCPRLRIRSAHAADHSEAARLSSYRCPARRCCRRLSGIDGRRILAPRPVGARGHSNVPALRRRRSGAPWGGD